MRGKSVFRHLLLRHRRSFNFRYLSSSSSSSSFPLNPNYRISTPKTDSSIPQKPCQVPIQESLHLPNRFSNFSRTFSSQTSSVPPNVVLVKSEGEFNAAFDKAQTRSKSAIFYFTAIWCGPCRVIAPRVEELACTYPHVTIYKVDIDEEGLASPLSKLDVHSVPTFHFFQKGKKASEVIGADLTSIVRIMKELYEKKD